MQKTNKNLNKVWIDSAVTAKNTTTLDLENLKNITNSVMSTGPYYTYIIDFFDLSLNHVHDHIKIMHEIDIEMVTLDDIIALIHPEDYPFVVEAESKIVEIFTKELTTFDLLNYKISYNFRMKMKDGNYSLVNHQAIILTLDDEGKCGKSLNIHTRIDHLSKTNTYTFSLIPIDQKSPGYYNISIDKKTFMPKVFSNREIEIIKLISEGFTNDQIGQKLFISVQTVKKHRTNILTKSQAKNTSELIKTCILQGII